MPTLAYPFDGAEILQKKRALKKELSAKDALVEKRIAIVGGSTVGEIKNILELFLLDAGIRPVFYEGGYGLFYENVVFDDGALAAFQPDVLYIHTSNHNLRAWPSPADSVTTAEDKLQAEYTRFSAVWDAATQLNCAVIQNNFEEPLWRNFGNLDAVDIRGRVRFVRQLNEKMAAYAAGHQNFYVHDLAYLAASHGLDAWCDVSTWYAYKYCCAVQYIPDLCHSLASLIQSLFGKTKKGVVSDLDNTLWGGIVGEVGSEGIEVGSETPAGMAYAELQSYLKTLSQRGILLTVASKNEEAAALSGFTRAGSVLSREDFLAFEANWNPKSHSIAKIAQDLNIGADSLVFIDDNPAERQEVTRALPQVAAPAIGAVEYSIRALDRGGYFEVSSLSADDVHRSEMYRENALRKELEQSAGNYEDYLKSLAMTADILPFRPETLERVTQLINKTNQFNLTTRRYTAAETQQCMDDADTVTLSGRLVDTFGDNGITSAIIAHQQGDTLSIDLWVMSCRVFKRHLEFAMFDALMAEARRRGIHTITGRWLPTAKNLLVKDFYATIGFDLVAETDAERVFERSVPQEYTPYNQVIKVENKDG